MNKTRMERRNAGSNAEQPETERSRLGRRRSSTGEEPSSEAGQEAASRRSRYAGRKEEPEEEEPPMLTLPHTLLAAFIFIVITALASPFIISMFQ
ncbi:hypothetical protein CHL76_05945 [Marinococcus halophilus]|uniref:Uncharacterized protein n=1 Tax=Marinococcus halophilus TaxID=1371 RepID=A0A510Y3Q4_MARHA|nr:hypothetical protein [Marinococcus halophilus]OZT80870.1 hypothetical protein CHL76_05945 [Marinococcus halophilus]GEK57925.1 hypothetical protein MHA01_08300 [Marinococcus halophilus]